MSQPKAVMCWSSGKDSAWALHVAREQGEVEVVSLLTTITEPYERVSMHGVRESILDAQAKAVGLPLRKIPIPAPCPNEIYESRMRGFLEQAKVDGITHVVFGDLFLEDLRQWREARLAEVNMQGVFPIWTTETAELARTMIANGVKANITCLDPKIMPRELAGHAYDEALLAALPEGVDPCAENGEFHSVAWDGPAFTEPLRLVCGETVEREGFVFTDFMLAADDVATNA